ncbi:MAG: flavodoxin [Methanomethylophilus sp.]|jgi:flavodoxin
MNPLVVYFSVGGDVRRTAEMLSAIMQADILRLEPESTWESDPSNGYDTVIVGFPLIMFKEPAVIDRFLQACDLRRKAVFPFYVSGSLKDEHKMPGISKSAPKAEVYPAKWFVSDAPLEDVEAWSKAITAARMQPGL